MFDPIIEIINRIPAEILILVPIAIAIGFLMDGLPQKRQPGEINRIDQPPWR